MSESKKTLAFVGVAVLLMGTAVLATWPRERRPAEFVGQGEPFFPNFTDPLACTSLEVIDFDEETASAVPFKVELKDGKWVIPSHYDYPADAKDRLAKTAAGVIDLKKDVVVSDRPDQWEELGVIDPLDTKSTSLKGRGKRVTLKDKSGEILADLIIGKPVPGRSGQRYVRVPDPRQRWTYAVNVNVDLSTRFADWIETNLLKVDTSKIRKVTFDLHKVDPERRTLEKGEVLTVERKDSTAPWQLEGGLPEGQELDTAKLSTLTTALADLKIVGVRPKPPGLTQDLKLGDGKVTPTTNQALASLLTKGFYPTRDGLYSNQGEVRVACEDGVVYTLRFGEVTFATGEALSAGKEEDQPQDKAKGKEKEKDKEGSKAEGVESRYLMVTAAFDSSLIAAPAPPKVAEAGELPADVFQRTAQEKADKEKAEKEKAEREKADYERKVEAGKKRAKELTDRFAAWYYVVPGSAFRDIRLDRSALIRPKSESKDTAAPPASGLNFNPGGLPPGHP
ncbi:MAG: DUF4340 domain-containing protein [Isosphaeraceae bacterium]|nr:DUF4340 domain-containing protein [Isosphaeraceae bacterium]